MRPLPTILALGLLAGGRTKTSWSTCGVFMLVLVLFACSVSPQDLALTPADFDLETADRPSAPPTPLSLSGPAVAEPGSPVRFEVGGALEGERAWLLVGGEEAPGAGPCPSVLGGYCLDLTRPVGIYDSAITDAEGVATIDTDAPIWPGASGCFQAVVMRGPAGVFSGLSNVVCMTACAEGDTDGDGVCDESDLCPGEDDTLDDDADGIPDGCQRKLLAGTGNILGFMYRYGYPYDVYADAGALWSIDLDTGVVIRIMDTGFPITGLATGPDDTIYAVAGGGSYHGFAGSVYTIDLDTLTTSLLSDGYKYRGSLEMVDETLWLVSDSHSCLTIDPVDGARTPLPGVPDSGTGHALAWDGDVLWRVSADSLHTLDADCEQTVVASPGGSGSGGGATWYNGELYMVVGTTLYTVDTITGVRTSTGIGFPEQVDALTVAPIGF
ncbi:MAG: hypothetical protein ACI8PZ_005611 [Myxococcota bacterium]|jgi:hypothetical protein